MDNKPSQTDTSHYANVPSNVERLFGKKKLSFKERGRQKRMVTIDEPKVTRTMISKVAKKTKKAYLRAGKRLTWSEAREEALSWYANLAEKGAL